MIVYLDHAATAPVCAAAVFAMAEATAEEFGNPSSLHRAGLIAGAALKRHREDVADALGCAPEELFFTSGGTESDNWAVFSGAALGARHGRHVIATAVEHPAVLNAMKELQNRGFEVTLLPPGKDGNVPLEALEQALREDTVLVSMMHVNNETGAILPVRQAGALLKARKSAALFHVDAVQSFLKLPFTPAELGADLVSISAHKIGGPKGIGALYIRKGVRLGPLLFGGGQENGLRSGTEPTVQAAGFAAACRERKEHFHEESARISDLKRYTLERLQAAFPRMERIGAGEAPHILNVSLPGYRSEVLVRYLSDLGICVSAGSACHRGRPSQVLAAMKLPPKTAGGALRISFGHENTKEDADVLCAALTSAAAELFPAL